MRFVILLITLALVSCDVEEAPAPTIEPVPDDHPVLAAEDVDEPTRDAGDGPCCGVLDLAHDESWLANNEGDFDSAPTRAYLDAQPVSVREMLARVRAHRSRRIAFEWPEEERVDISRTDDLGLALARVTWSEEGVEVPRRADALYQVTRNVRARHCDGTRYGQRVRRGRRRGIPITECRSPEGVVRAVQSGEVLDGWEETELSALRRLSRFVTGMAPPHRARTEWLSTLVTCDAPPSGWVECVDENNDGRRDGACSGTWSNFVERCTELLEHSRALVAMEWPPRPCAGTPIAWGGSMDSAIMERRNAARLGVGLRPLVPLACGDVENTYYGTPRRSEPSQEELPAAEDDRTIALGQVAPGSPPGPFNR